MKRVYFPVTANEIGHGHTRISEHLECTMAVRELYTSSAMPEPYAMLAYGHPMAYEYVKVDGKTYGVFKHDDPETREFRG